VLRPTVCLLINGYEKKSYSHGCEKAYGKFHAKYYRPYCSAIPTSQLGALATPALFGLQELLVHELRSRKQVSETDFRKYV
jgi:hypothetical protein